MKTIKKLLSDAWAFMTDKDARTNSSYSYPNGYPMSVRDAKKQGLL